MSFETNLDSASAVTAVTEEHNALQEEYFDEYSDKEVAIGSHENETSTSSNKSEPANPSETEGDFLPQVFIIELAHPDDPANIEQVKLRDKYGVQIEERDGKYHYLLQANGEKKELFSTDASEDGLKEADTNLREIVDAEISSLEEEYAVKINREGYHATAKYIVYGVGLPAEQQASIRDLGEVRDPSLVELAGVRAGLENSMPSNVVADPKNLLQINFLKNGFGPVAEFTRDQQDNPEVLFYPTFYPMPATEADVTVDAKGGRQPSVEYVFTHELAHHSQVALDGSDMNDRGTFREDSGWTPIFDSETGLTEWAIKGADGYNYVLGGGGYQPRFYRVDEDLNLLDADGKTTTQMEHAHSLSIKEMQDLAVVRPPSDYFFNPDEMFAECIATYRVNEEGRARLMTESPVAYAVTQSYDQREIDAIYGKYEDGSSVYIRMPDGRLGDNTEENRQIVADFESAGRR